MYLTEEGLKGILDIVYPDFIFTRDKIVPNSGIRNRPDYRNEELKLIVEFDGNTHYTQTKTIVNDEKKDRVYSGMGYRIIRIPYFVQASKYIIKLLFDKDVDIEQSYPHGFIDKKAILPADYCSLGLKRYNNDLVKFELIRKEINDSLINKVDQLGDKRLVFPLSH